MASDKKNNDNKEKKGKVSKILIAILVLAVLGVGSFFGMKMYMEKKGDTTEVTIKEGFYEVGEIMVKLSDEGGKRFLKTKVALTYDTKNKELTTELEEKKLAIRDASIYYFMSKKVKDFEPENEVQLKKGLIDKINGILKSGRVIDVKFSDLITQ